LEYRSPLEGVDSPESLTETLRKTFQATGSDIVLGEKLLAYSSRLFRGELASHQPNTLNYHDYQHTLQAAYCFLDLVYGQSQNSANSLGPREVELGFAAILLHDSGYLKVSGDNDGSGAKYTYSHVLRSCALAATLLPSFGCQVEEIDLVVGAIRCTGLNGNPGAINFSSANARTIGCMIATADYLGQMGAPQYPEKLPYLFAEFTEADDFTNVPQAKRSFPSVEAMLSATPGFWLHFVRPKLDADFASVHRFLSPTGKAEDNPYLKAVELNIAVIVRHSSANAKA